MLYNTSKVEKLQREVNITKAKVEDLKDRLVKATQAVMSDPNNEGAATKAAALTMQVKAMEASLVNAQEALEAEQKRLSGPEAKKALKELEKVNKEGLALTEEITEEARALYKKMERWVELQKQSKRLAREWEGNPFDLGIAGSRLINLKMAVGRWVQEIHSWERHAEIMAAGSGAKPAHNKKVLPLGEREKMLRERYPVKRG